MLQCSDFFFSSRRRHTRCYRDWSSDVCSSDLWCPSTRRRAPSPAATTLRRRATTGRASTPDRKSVVRERVESWVEVGSVDKKQLEDRREERRGDERLGLEYDPRADGAGDIPEG